MKIIYKLPISSTALFSSPEFQKGFRRNCALVCRYESINGEGETKLTLKFEGVEAFKCTYHRAVNSKIIQDAYDTVIDCGHSLWFGEITGNLLLYDEVISNLSHLAIYFDDGPCYEFICRSFITELEKKV